MKKLITTMIMLAILVFALSTSVQAYSMSYAGTKTEVESGETFNVTISVDESTVLANGKLSYDNSLFTFVEATQSSMSANAYPGEGRVNWMYTDLGSNDSELQKGTGTKTFIFTFKAADVTENKKGTFTLKDFTVTTSADAEYDDASNSISGTKSVDVTIKKKVETPTDNWTIDPAKDFELSIGETKKIKTDGDVTWSTSDSKIATVDKDGNVKGIGKGTATITAKDKDGNTKSVKVTVNDIKWKLDPSGDITIKLDETKKIKTDEKVTWSTSNPKVVTVDKDGNIKGVGVGTATITATDKFGNKRTIKVTVVSKTAGTKDNTTTPDKKLPQTGEDFTRFACLALAGIVLVAGLVFKKKAKNLNKLFVILPLVAALSISGTVNAIKLVDSTKMKAGIFNDLIEGKNVIAVSPCKEFKTENSLTVDMVKSIVGMDILKIADAKGNKIENSENIATGYVVTTPHPYSNGEQVVEVETNYEILLYGDANGDGRICNSLDVNVIRQDYVFNNKAEGVYKKAADLYADDVLNVRDVQRMVKKYIGTLEGSLVTPFPGEKNIVLNPSEDITLNIGDTQTITAKDEDGNNVDVTWTSSNPDVATVDENGKITAVGAGTTTITATDKNGNEQSIEVTVAEAVKPELTIDVKTNGNVATVTVDVTNKTEVEKYGNILPYEYVLKKVGTNGDTEIANVKTEDREYTFENLEDGDYELVIVVKTDKGAVNTKSIRFTIKNLDDGVTTDKTKAIAYARYYKDEETGYTGSIYFTSLQSAFDYVKNNVVRDHRTHTATIGLLKDTTESIVIDDEINNINFNLNGYTLTSAKAGNAITVNSPSMQLYVDNLEYNLDTEKENSTSKRTTGGINATGADGDNCVYLAGKNVIFTVNDHIVFGGITVNGAAIKAKEDTTTMIRIYDTTWETGINNAVFIDDLGNGGILIWGGTYKGYSNIIKQAGNGSINIGSDSTEISETEPENATPRFEARDSIITAPNSRINFNYGYLTQRTLNIEGFNLRNDAELYTTPSIAYYVKSSVVPDDGVTTDKTKAIAYARYYKDEETGYTGSIYFTSLQSAFDYVKNNVVKDQRKHTAIIGLLKDTTESIVIDDEINNINFNLNGYNLTSAKAGNTITVNSPSIQLYVDNFEYNLDTEKENSTSKRATGEINATGADGDNCVYLAGKNVIFTVNDHIVFGGITTNGAAIKAKEDTTTLIRIYDTTWETGINNATFIDDLGNGGILIWGGTYKGYSNIIKQAGNGTINIGSDSTEISETEPENATPRFEAHDSIITAPNSRINFNYGYLTQRTLNIEGFNLRNDAELYTTPSTAYYVKPSVEPVLDAEVSNAGINAVSDIVNN